jgi:hypothetical protein
MRSWVEHAHEAGSLLLQAKEQVKATNQNWLPWVEKHCNCSISEAQRYMRIAGNYCQLRNSGKDLTKMSMTQALQLLSPASSKSGTAQGSTVQPIKVSSQEEFNSLTQRGRDLDLKADSPEKKFIKDKAASIAKQVLKQALKSKLVNDKGALLSPSEIVVALLEHLKEALDVKLVLTIEEPATPVNKSVTATESGLSNMDDKNDGETEVAPPVPRNQIKDRLSVKKGKAA